MRNELHELLSMVNVLAEDADHARDVMARSDIGYSRRAYVRAVFAWIEGVCFLMRQRVLRERLMVPISEDGIGEIAALFEQTFTVDDKGQIKVSDLRTPMANNLIFTILASANIRGLSVRIDKSGKNWSDFRDALKIRDRITHPKKAEDLQITDEEVKKIKETCGWFDVHLAVVL